MIFRACDWKVEFPRRPLVMGIVNVTPDSFSDGGQFFDKEKALAHAIQLWDEGADIIDVGGESTRPKAEPVSEQVELKRVIPLIQAIKDDTNVPISVDTQKPLVAREAISAGAVIVNDIGSNREDRAMWQVVAMTGAGYVLMHMKGTPQTMQDHAMYRDVTADVNEYFSERLKTIQSSGVSPEQVVVDPGLGFAKNGDHNLQLLARLKQFKIHQRPMMIGASRKSFIGKLLGGDVTERLGGSIACALWAVMQGAQIIRTHDVRATSQALRMVEEIQQRVS